MTSAEATIPVEDFAADSDLDSAYGASDLESQTYSLRSAITDYVYENGRRYHACRPGYYWDPNGGKTSFNLDIIHHIFTLTLDGELFLAPIGANPQRVLDLGTGTGIWALDFADRYPSASVIGTSISHNPPRQLPPNLQFEFGDICGEPTFTNESFDYIHARSIYRPVADYSALYTAALNHLEPGAWFEQTEMAVVPKSEDDSIKGTAFETWGSVFLAAGDKFRKSLRIVDETKDRMEAAGFERVTYKKFKWPIGSWSKDKKLKEIGRYNSLMWDTGMEGWSMFLLTGFLGWQAEEVQVLCAHTRKALRDKSIHAYQDVSVCYGRKPMTSEPT